MERILVVDDDAFSRKLVDVALTGAGFSVTTARDGEEGWSKLQRNPINLIISDVEMPHMDGHQFARVVRQNPNYAAVPFLFLSSHTQQDERQLGLDLGADDYLTKPVNAKELVQKTRNILVRQKALHTSYRSLLQTAIDRVPVAVTLVDRQGRVQFSNGAFEALRGKGVWVRGDHLCGHLASLTSAMDSAIAEAFLGEQPEPVALQRDAPAPIYMIVSPVPPEGDEHCLAWVSLVDPLGKHVKNLAGNLFGFTAGENRIATLLLAGLTISEIQDRLKVSRPTINAHLRGMFTKTDTRRQAELIRRLLQANSQLLAAGGLATPQAVMA